MSGRSRVAKQGAPGPNSRSVTPRLFVRRFTVLDFARVGPSGFEGESLYVDGEVEGDLDERGFLMDFGPVKKLMKRVVDDVLDHRFAVPIEDPRVILEEQGERLRARIDGTLDYTAPREAFALLPDVSDASVCAFLRERVLERVPKNVRDVRFQLSPEDGIGTRPGFRYTHGLKLHEGNCQRLIHGHRNIIEVFLDGAWHPVASQMLAELFDDVHFAHVDDLTVSAPVGERFTSEQNVSILYRSLQGEFEATLPGRRVLPLSVEPTIENIATFSHQWVSRALSVDDERVTVRAYEGIHKGASAGPGFTR